jgi:hypothetical protein
VFIIFGEVRRGGREKNDYMVLVSGWCGGVCRSRWESDVALLRRIDVGDIISVSRKVGKIGEAPCCMLWKSCGSCRCPANSCGPKVNGSSSMGCMERDVCCAGCSVWRDGTTR